LTAGARRCPGDVGSDRRPACNCERVGFSAGFGFGFQEVHTVASVQERVIEIVSTQLGVSKDQITPATSFINDLGADSLDTVELVMELEEEFEINIPDDAAEKIQTVGQAVEFIEKHQG
jgi:acyl carrier protein